MGDLILFNCTKLSGRLRGEFSGKSTPLKYKKKCADFSVLISGFSTIETIAIFIYAEFLNFHVYNHFLDIIIIGYKEAKKQTSQFVQKQMKILITYIS